MIVLCLEGCHGAGKTELLRSFASMGHRVLEEAFLDMPRTGLHPQSLLMETTWVCDWFRRVLEVASNNNAPPLLVVDRSPFSAVLYADNGELLEPMVHAQIKELEKFCSVKIITAYLRVDPGILWSRITQRLRREPERERYREGDIDWMRHVTAFYEQRTWDLSVLNNDTPIEVVRDRLVVSL